MPAKVSTPYEATCTRPGEDMSREEILDKRMQSIGYNVAVNYRKNPLYISRGLGQFLYDENGIPYLDCVNNVAHVGHCHPKVVSAICDQFHSLNTNSRYLSPYVVKFAEEITATLPKDSNLKVVYWVNSGSEANDLALRLARSHTKKRGVMCVGGAYHGHVISIIDISPYKYATAGGTGRRKWVRQAPIPDVYAGMHRGRSDDDAMGAAYAAEVDKHLASFKRQEERESKRKQAWMERKKAASTGAGASAEGDSSDDEFDDDGLEGGCGAFIMESILSCGGQVMPPKGYLRRVYESVRKAGGICIADEVQVGFGRVGSNFWAFELQGEGVYPDILTLGKPLGNGYPASLVITTPEIAASFDNGMEYFNTYGGNPPAARSALATLQVIKDEKLQHNALVVGQQLVAGFTDLALKFDFVGSVRGTGLMIGIEVVDPSAAPAGAPYTPAGGAVDMDSLALSRSHKPWSEAAYAVVYAMRKRRVLLSVDGMEENIIKLKPPMCFSAADASHIITVLGDVMAHLPDALAEYKDLSAKHDAFMEQVEERRKKDARK